MKGPSCGAPILTNIRSFLLKVAEMERSFIGLEAHMLGLVGSDLENVLGPCLEHTTRKRHYFFRDQGYYWAAARR